MTSRRPGEIVCRKPGSCFVGSGQPRYVYLLGEGEYEGGCFLCEDPHCREWPDVLIVAGPYVGEVMFHLAECQMEDFEGPGGREL